MDSYKQKVCWALSSYDHGLLTTDQRQPLVSVPVNTRLSSALSYFDPAREERLDSRNANNPEPLSSPKTSRPSSSHQQPTIPLSTAPTRQDSMAEPQSLGHMTPPSLRQHRTASTIANPQTTANSLPVPFQPRMSDSRRGTIQGQSSKALHRNTSFDSAYPPGPPTHALPHLGPSMALPPISQLEHQYHQTHSGSGLGSSLQRGTSGSGPETSMHNWDSSLTSRQPTLPSGSTPWYPHGLAGHFDSSSHSTSQHDLNIMPEDPLLDEDTFNSFVADMNWDQMPVSSVAPHQLHNPVPVHSEHLAILSGGNRAEHPSQLQGPGVYTGTDSSRHHQNRSEFYGYTYGDQAGPGPSGTMSDTRTRLQPDDNHGDAGGAESLSSSSSPYYAQGRILPLSKLSP